MRCKFLPEDKSDLGALDSRSKPLVRRRVRTSGTFEVVGNIWSRQSQTLEVYFRITTSEPLTRKL